MEHTATYGLTQWSKSDRIKMEDFNSDNLKVEQALAGLAASAGNCKIVTGSYIGTGNNGSSRPRTLTFDGKPLVILVNGGGYSFFALRGSGSAPVCGGNSTPRAPYITWLENGVQWYHTSVETAAYQMDLASVTYYYAALLLSE